MTKFTTNLKNKIRLLPKNKRHKCRSSDASTFDTICVYCGSVDVDGPDGGECLSTPKERRQRKWA